MERVEDSGFYLSILFKGKKSVSGILLGGS
jgi:hypothetical protein